MNALKLVYSRSEETEEVNKVNEDGFVAIPNDLFDALISSDLSERQLRLCLAIIRKTHGYRKVADDVTISQLAGMVGLDRGNASKAFNALVELNVVSAGKGKHGFITALNTPEKWATRPCQNNTNVSCQNDTTVSKQHAQPCQNDTHNIQLQQTKEDLFVVDKKPSPTKQPEKGLACPAEQILDLYHEMLPELPAVKSFNAKRRKALSDRWQEVCKAKAREAMTNPEAKAWETKADGLEWFRRFFAVVSGSDWLMGREDSEYNRRRKGGPWTADFDYLTTQDGFTRVWEQRV